MSPRLKNHSITVRVTHRTYLELWRWARHDRVSFCDMASNCFDGAFRGMRLVRLLKEEMGSRPPFGAKSRFKASR